MRQQGADYAKCPSAEACTPAKDLPPAAQSKAMCVMSASPPSARCSCLSFHDTTPKDSEALTPPGNGAPRLRYEHRRAIADMHLWLIPSCTDAARGCCPPPRQFQLISRSSNPLFSKSPSNILSAPYDPKQSSVDVTAPRHKQRQTMLMISVVEVRTCGSKKL